jgi:mRNA interferase RelE/StbE
MASNFEDFSIVWLKSAHKNFEKLPITTQKAIAKQIDFLNTPHENSDIKKLKGHSDLYRLRVGDYRVIFSINKQTEQIRISAVGHRREIYNLISN